MRIFAQDWLVYLVVTLLALAVARWFFRSMRQEIARRNAPPARGTAVLPWLRAALAGLLVLGFAKPFYTQKTAISQPGQVAIVLDTESGLAQAPPESSPEQRLRLMRNLNLIGEKDADLKAMSLADEFAEAINAMKGLANEEKRKKRLAQWQEFVERQDRETKITEAGRLPAHWSELVRKKLIEPARELDKNMKIMVESAAELRDKLKAHAVAAAPAQLAAPTVAAASSVLQKTPAWERLRKLLAENGLWKELGRAHQVTLYLWAKDQLHPCGNVFPGSDPELPWPELALPEAASEEDKVQAAPLSMDNFNAGFASGSGRRAMVLFSAPGSDPAASASLTAGFRSGACPVHVVAVGAGGQEGRSSLREIASQSNGQFLRESETDRLPTLLAGLARQKTERQTHLFFHHAAVYLLAAALFLTELFLRKRHGLL